MTIDGLIRSGTEGIEQVECLRASGNGVIRLGTDYGMSHRVNS